MRPDFPAAKSRSSSRATRKTPRQSRRARSKDHRRDFSSSEPPIPSASGTKSRRRRPRYERQSAASAATSKQGAIGSAAARSSRPFAGTSFERKDRRLRCSERERGSAAKREIDMGDWASTRSRVFSGCCPDMMARFVGTVSVICCRVPVGDTVGAAAVSGARPVLSLAGMVLGICARLLGLRLPP